MDAVDIGIEMERECRENGEDAERIYPEDAPNDKVLKQRPTRKMAAPHRVHQN